ncbi:hypothetical protein BT63DRAFT_233211 [Microthyrium microscopicum]|uniref:Uncharacterized protein n=1 Tax=Microthyrium microscopicum TaxID=703497 RepID=A0A6A6UFE2_9PEZI|nr:hypothetical protein BT63DRAFT_233211 [Microthyrium microscopicum]
MLIFRSPYLFHPISSLQTSATPQLLHDIVSKPLESSYLLTDLPVSYNPPPDTSISSIIHHRQHEGESRHLSHRSPPHRCHNHRRLCDLHATATNEARPHRRRNHNHW